MLTILMESRNNDADLAQTLSALVLGAVEGLVRDVVILDRGSSDGSSLLADAAGARFCESWEMGDILRSVRGEWLLLLEPGARPTGRWIDDIAEYMALARSPACFTLSRLHRRPLRQWFLRRKRPLEKGLLISRQQALTLVRPAMGLADLAAVRPVRRLSCELVPAWVSRANRIERPD